MDNKNFKPGDILEFIASPDFRFQVLERLEQTCHGGTQVHYVGRVHSTIGFGSHVASSIEAALQTVHCIELQPCPQELPDVSKFLRAAILSAGGHEGLTHALHEVHAKFCGIMT